ncbi:MAG: type II secretion system F family protein [bacterium]
MPDYRYSAKDESGREVAGVYTAPTRFDALTQLHDRGLTVTEISDEGIGVGGIDMVKVAAKKGRVFGRVSSSDKAIFCRQLSISVSAGIPLRESLESITADLDNAAFRRVLERVLKKLDDGAPFSSAIMGESKIFDRLFIALIRTAEEAGSLTETLNYLATSMEKNDRLSRKIKSILAYPMFIGGFFLLISGIMTIFVLPQFQDIFKGFGNDLPPLTRAVFTINTFVIHNTLWIFLGVATAILSFILYASTKAGRFQIDGMLVRLPLIGDIIRKLAVSRFCRNFGIMMTGGVPVATAIEIAAEVLGNKVMEASMKATRDRIMAGNNIASSLDKKVFPRLVARMVGVGESSGRLPEVLNKVADVYEDQVEGTIMVVISLIEPIIIAVFGGLILLLVLAIYMPVFSSAGHMK